MSCLFLAIGQKAKRLNISDIQAIIEILGGERLMNLLYISLYINMLCLNIPDTVARLLHDFDKR